MVKITKENFESNIDYTTVLDDFEGPLDLLLFLINKEEIKIEDIFVSKVTEQFLVYMKGVEYLDIEKAGEYLNVAATIVEIKAKSLVPNQIVDEDDDDDPEGELIRALEEYKLFKEESKKLKELETIGYYFKEPDKDVGEVKVVYKDFNLDGLLSAFTKLMLKNEELNREKDRVREIPLEEFTVEDRIDYIKESVTQSGSVSFLKLFSKHHSKSEIITTFQALLELLKLQYVNASQTDVYGDILITLNPDRSEALNGEFSEDN